MKNKSTNEYVYGGEETPDVDLDKPRRMVTNSFHFLWVLLIAAVGIYCSYFSPKAPIQIADRAIREAPLISVKDMKAYCNSGKPVKMELFTGEALLARSGTKYAYENFTGYRKVPRKDFFSRQKRECSVLEVLPEQIVLYSADHKPVLSADSQSIDVDFLRQIHSVKQNQTDKLDVPVAWVPQFEKAELFDLVMLPANAPVSVIGAIAGKPGHYTLTGFVAEGHGLEKDVTPIVCAAPMQKVLAKLK